MIILGIILLVFYILLAFSIILFVLFLYGKKSFIFATLCVVAYGIGMVFLLRFLVVTFFGVE